MTTRKQRRLCNFNLHTLCYSMREKIDLISTKEFRDNSVFFNFDL